MGATATAGAVPVVEELIAHINGMKVHGGPKSPAPHKPLLLLLAIWRRALQPAADRLFSYEQAHGPMVALLVAAGRVKNPRPWYPFVRLRTEPFWELSGVLVTNQAGDVSSARALTGIRAGFRPRFDDALHSVLSAEAVADAIASQWLPEPSQQPLNDRARDLAGSL
jgi:hypothetical protein